MSPAVRLVPLFFRHQAWNLHQGSYSSESRVSMSWHAFFFRRSVDLKSVVFIEVAVVFSSKVPCAGQQPQWLESAEPIRGTQDRTRQASCRIAPTIPPHRSPCYSLCRNRKLQTSKPSCTLRLLVWPLQSKALRWWRRYKRTVACRIPRRA